MKDKFHARDSIKWTLTFVSVKNTVGNNVEPLIQRINIKYVARDADLRRQRCCLLYTVYVVVEDPDRNWTTRKKDMIEIIS